MGKKSKPPPPPQKKGGVLDLTFLDDRLTQAEAKELSPFTVRATSSNGRRSSATYPQVKADTEDVDDETRLYKEKNVRTLENIVNATLDPTVNPTETKEYRR
jgi:hypothetical protein